MKCKNCGRGDLRIIKKHGVCTNCYGKLRRRNEINVLPHKNPKPYLVKADHKRRLKEKFGNQIIKDLDNLKTKPFFNLSVFGDKYNITRERARQIFSRYFDGESIRKYQKIKAKKIKADLNMVACDAHPKIKNAEYISHSSKALHSKALLNVFNMCEKLQYDVVFNKVAKCDFIINGHKVCVSSCNSVSTSNKKYPNGIRYWRFLANSKTRDKDFAIFYIHPKKEYYIIPVEKIKGGRMVYIPADNEKGSNNFLKYLGKWELLKGE